MIDYNATLQEFFKEVIKYLDSRASHALSELEYQQICKAREQVQKIASNPVLYADYNTRVANGVEPDAEPFMPNSHDNSVYLILSKVLFYMGNLNSEFSWYRKEAQENLLKARRAIAYKNSTNILKDIKFAFIRPEKFAVKKR